MTIKFNSQTAMNKLNQTQAIPDKIWKKAYDFFVRATPIRSGNARNNTRLKGKTIDADYAYAQRLDKESWSRQAPNGMTEPTIKEIERLIRAEIRKVK
jgi:hypothetical protein